MTSSTDRHACGTHLTYALGCDDYDAIREKHKGMCWRCRINRAGQIDHAHAAGLAAVRGYVCAPCNLRMAKVDAGAAPGIIDQQYLDGAWYASRSIPFIPDDRTALRTVRIEEDLWLNTQAIAHVRRETLSAVMKRALVEYVEKHGGSVER